MIRATNWTFMNNVLAVFVGDSSGSGALAIKSSSSSSTFPNVPSKFSETLRSKWSSSFPSEKYVISISSASWKVRRISDSLPLSGPMLLLMCFSSQSQTHSPPFCTFPLQCNWCPLLEMCCLWSLLPSLLAHRCIWQWKDYLQLMPEVCSLDEFFYLLGMYTTCPESSLIIIIIIIIIIVYWYPSRSLKAELQGRSVTLTEDNTIQKQSNR